MSETRGVMQRTVVHLADLQGLLLRYQGRVQAGNVDDDRRVRDGEVLDEIIKCVQAADEALGVALQYAATLGSEGGQGTVS